MKKRILTYGTFDLFHIGHLNLLKRLKDMGGFLAVGVSSDEFNLLKGKRTVIRFEDRAEIVRATRYVDEVFPETSWEQKIFDVKTYGITTFAMGDDWAGKFDFLREHCEVIYLPRTDGISSSAIREELRSLNKNHVAQLKQTLDLISEIVSQLE